MTVWRNWIARWTSDPAVAGSSPVTVEYIFLYTKRSIYTALQYYMLLYNCDSVYKKIFLYKNISINKICELAWMGIEPIYLHIEL